MGDEVHFRGIIEFSNHCMKNCLYCGLRRDNRALARYRLKPDEIMKEPGKPRGWGAAPWFSSLVKTIFIPRT
jgi:biotin synthase